MEIIQIATFAIIATILAVTIKSQRPEIAILISTTAGIIILFFLLTYLKSIITLIQDISNKLNFDLSIFTVIFKIIAIAYISEFSSQICKDAGEKSIASKVELAGKILILLSSIPVIFSLIQLLSDIL